MSRYEIAPPPSINSTPLTLPVVSVCRTTIREMEKRIKKVDPKKKVEISGFRMDSKETKSISFVKSEMFLTELMEEICKKYHFTYVYAALPKCFKPTWIFWGKNAYHWLHKLTRATFIFSLDMTKMIMKTCCIVQHVENEFNVGTKEC